MTKEQAYEAYKEELREAAEYCEENYGYSHGSNYELMCEDIHRWWVEQYPEWFC